MKVLRQTIVLLNLFVSPLVFSQGETILFTQSEYQFPYQINKPDKIWKLPKNLVEISGLSFVNTDKLACVQDEKGKLYIYNLAKEQVDTKIDFGKDGDYEGVEIIGTDVWIIKSNGHLYKIGNYLNKSKSNIIKYKTPLSENNDVEGLAYDTQNNSLLVACKGFPFVDNNGENKEAKDYKTIYNFNIETTNFDANPFLLIKMDSIKKYLNYDFFTRIGIAFNAFFDATEGDSSFQPSGIAIHPTTKNIYVLASVGKLLVVFSKDKKILSIVKLNPKIHRQPEGICFDTNGNLYISNEGKGKKGNILKFKKSN